MKINYLNSELEFIKQIKKYHKKYDKIFFITQNPILNQNDIIKEIIHTGYYYICSNSEQCKTLKEYEKIIHDSKNEVKNYFNKAREKVLKDIDNKKEVLENNINEEIVKVEKEISELKNKSAETINKIAIEISSDIVKQLIGVQVNNSSISATVENISKKVKEKNYVN